MTRWMSREELKYELTARKGCAKELSKLASYLFLDWDDEMKVGRTKGESAVDVAIRLLQRSKKESALPHAAHAQLALASGRKG